MVKDELAAWELPVDLDSLIALTIRIDGRLRERWSEKKSGLGDTRSFARAGSPSKESRSFQRQFF